MKQLPLYSPYFIDLEKAFGNWLSALGYAESSVYYMPLQVRNFFFYLEQQGYENLEEVYQKHARGYMNYLQERGHQKQPNQRLSESYLNKHLQALKLLSKYVRQIGQSALSIHQSNLQSPYTIKTILSQEDIQSLYQACGNDILGKRDRLMLSLFYGCGLRRTEGVQLNVKDVLIEQKLLYVRKGKNYKERYVPMSQSVLDDLAMYLQDSRPYFYHAHQQKALLLSLKGKRIHGQSLSIRLRELIEKVQLPSEITLHTLRHSIATHLLQNGMKLKQVAQFLGHKSIESTQIYTHLMNDE